MTLEVPMAIWGTEANLDITAGREGGQFLGHVNAGDGPFVVTDHYYFGGTPDQPQDCYFKIRLPAPVTVNGETYTEGWVIGCNSFQWKVRFSRPTPPPTPGPGPHVVNILTLTIYSDGTYKIDVPKG